MAATRMVFGSLRGPDTPGDIPEGYKVEHDKRGTAFLVPAGETTQHHRLPACSSDRAIGDAFGEGYYLYFDFIKALIIFDTILVFFGILAWAPHVAHDGWYNIGTIQQRYNFYIVSYSHDMKPWWMAGTIGALVMTFLFGPLYALRLVHFFRSRNKVDHEGHYGRINDVIPGNENLTWTEHFCRMLISYFLMLLFLCVAAAVTFTLIVLRENAAGFKTSVGTGQVQLAFSFAIAIFLKISNALWFLLSDQLTKIEKHQTYTQKKEHLTLKYYIFRVLNVSVVYISAWLIHHKWYHALVRPENRLAENPCGIPAAGDEYFIIFLSEIVWANLWNIVLYPCGVYLFKRFLCHKSHDEDKRKELWSAFDVAYEYMELLYRQLIIYLGLPVFPLVSFLALLAHFISYVLDRVRLTRFSQEPRPLKGSMKGFLVFFLLVTAAVGAGLFPNGIIWVVGGFYYKHNCPGTVFAAGNTTAYFENADF